MTRCSWRDQGQVWAERHARMHLWSQWQIDFLKRFEWPIRVGKNSGILRHEFSSLCQAEQVLNWQSHHFHSSRWWVYSNELYYKQQCVNSFENNQLLFQGRKWHWNQAETKGLVSLKSYWIEYHHIYSCAWDDWEIQSEFRNRKG